MFAHSSLCPKIALLLSGILCVFLFPSLLLMPLACQRSRCIWCINSVLSSCSFLFLSSTALYPFHCSAQPEQEQWSHVKCMYKAVFMYPFYSAWNQIRHWDDLIKTLHQFEVLTSVDSVFKYKQLQFTGGRKETLNFPNWNHLCVWVCSGAPGQQGIPQGQIINDRPLRRARRTLEQKRVAEVDFMMLWLKVSWLWPWILMQNVTSRKSGFSITFFR